MTRLDDKVSKLKQEPVGLVQARVPKSKIERMAKYKEENGLTWDSLIEVLFDIAIEEMPKRKGA